MSDVALAVLPPDSVIGSDGRPHHKYGFSFATVLEKCPAARRSKSSAKNIKDAGERGVELHGVLEQLVLDWVDAVAKKPQPPTILELFETQYAAGKFKGRLVADLISLKRVAAEISPFLSPEPGMLVGTEERIDLHGPDGEIISFGWYDLFVKLGQTALIIDHKFVRKEVDEAEKNRQGHCFAVSTWQTYEVEDVVVLFTMPECGSSIHRFSRTTDFQRLEQELWEIFAKTDRPYKTLQAGDHCVYCEFRGTCEAAIGTVKTLTTGINPLAVPADFTPHLIKTAEDMAVLRYWADTCLPIIEEIKAQSLKWAQAGQGISATVNGQLVEYAVQSRGMPRKVGEPIEIWKFVNEWMPVEALLSACKIGIVDLETVVVALISDRLIAEGKTPSPSAIAEKFSESLMAAGLLTREEGRTFFLKRVKASAKSKKKKTGGLQEVAPPVEDARPETQNDS